MNRNDFRLDQPVKWNKRLGWTYGITRAINLSGRVDVELTSFNLEKVDLSLLLQPVEVEVEAEDRVSA